MEHGRADWSDLEQLRYSREVQAVLGNLAVVASIAQGWDTG